MDYRRLGRSGLKVSEICLGTMTFGNGADEAEAARMVSAAFDSGVNFFDTANSYVGGVSETMLGKALKGRRHDAVVASKVFNPMGGRPNDSGMSRLHIKQQVEDSLWRLMEALWLSDSHGWTRFDAYQPQYSLVVRDIDEELMPAFEAKGLGVVAWSPLAGGYLAGKYRPGELKVQGTRSAEGWGFQGRFFAPNHGEILQTLLDTAKELNRSPAQVALRWVMDQPFMTSAIVGARNAQQLGETLGAGGWRLPMP